MTEPQSLEQGLLTLRPVAWYRGLLPEKFGLPRQSGLVPDLTGRVEMAEGFREREALRGLEGFSHLWLIWGFSRNHTWSPTVRPPRLGGNTRLGVFATRSPFRPNPLGLSLVELDKIIWEGPHGPELWVKGADLMDGTPIMTSSPTCPTPMPVPTHGAASPRERTAPWRYNALRNFWPNCRKTNGGPFWGSCPRTPDPITRKIRTGSTVWPSENGM